MEDKSFSVKVIYPDGKVEALFTGSMEYAKRCADLFIGDTAFPCKVQIFHGDTIFEEFKIKARP